MAIDTISNWEYFLLDSLCYPKIEEYALWIHIKIHVLWFTYD